MSYTNETTHFGIPLPLGSDLTTPMDYNESAQKIDTALFGAVTDATAGLEKANAVEESLGTTNDNLSNVTGRVTTLEGTVGTQGNAITQLNIDVADVRTDALDMICAVDEGTAQIATVAVQKDKYFRYNDVLYIATADIAIGDTIVPNTNCRATNVATELENIEGGSTPIGEIEAEDVTFNDTLAQIGATDVQSAIVALKTLIDNIEIGGDSMPTLNYTTPIWTPSTDSLTFTASDTCYLIGSIAKGTNGNCSLSINNQPIGEGAHSGTNGYGWDGFVNLKLTSGDTVVVSTANTDLKVYAEK